MSGRTAGRPEASAARVGGAGTTAMLAGSLVSGLAAYAFQVVGTRALGEQAYAPIGVLWTIQYLALTTVIVSAEAYLTRSVTLFPDDAAVLRRAVASLAAWVAVVAIAVTAACYRWREPLFGGAGSLAIVAGLTVVGYGCFAVIRGRLAGTARFTAYGVATGMEGLVRLSLAIPIAATVPTTGALAWSLPFGPLSVGAWWLAVRNRLRAGSPHGAAGTGPLTTGSVGRYLAATTVANAAAQTLLAGGPLLLIPLEAGPAEISVFFITITAARIPLVFAFGGMLSRVLPPLTRAAAGGEVARLRRFAVGLCAGAVVVGAIGAVAGATVGPRLVVAFFGAAFEPPGWFVALTAAGMVGATAALFLNQLLIAMGAEIRLVAPWLAALAAGAVTVALTAGSPTSRVATAFVVGEAVALIGLLSTVLLMPHVPRPSEPATMAV